MIFMIIIIIFIILHIRTFCISEHPPVPMCSDMRGSTVLSYTAPPFSPLDSEHNLEWSNGGNDSSSQKQGEEQQ